MSSTVGYTAHPTLAGRQLVGVSPVDFEVGTAQGILVQTLATGHRRKTGFFQGLGLPDIQLLLSWRIDYTKLTIEGEEGYLDFVDWMISRPGLHTFTNWKMTRLTWTVTAGQTEFFLPWRIANYFVPLPTEDTMGLRIGPVITTDPIDTAQRLTIVTKTTAIYDITSPQAGEACIDTEGTRFKVGDTLAVGSVLYGKFVPLHNVFLEQEVVRQMVTGKEGRVLVVQEV